jgi:hypothetical protein
MVYGAAMECAQDLKDWELFDLLRITDGCVVVPRPEQLEQLAQGITDIRDAIPASGNDDLPMPAVLPSFLHFDAIMTHNGLPEKCVT